MPAYDSCVSHCKGAVATILRFTVRKRRVGHLRETGSLAHTPFYATLALNQMVIAMSWATYSSTSSLSCSVQTWLAESSGTKVSSISMFSFISFFTSVYSTSPGDIANIMEQVQVCTTNAFGARKRLHRGQTVFQPRIRRVTALWTIRREASIPPNKGG